MAQSDITQINANFAKALERMRQLQGSVANPDTAKDDISAGADYGEGFDVNALRDKMTSISSDVFHRMSQAKEEPKAEKPSFLQRLKNAVVAFFRELFGIKDTSEVDKELAVEPEPEVEPEAESETEEEPVVTEKFEEIFAEMQANVPDSTSTIEEKELALEYIDRMLACEDIPNADYWQNKKDTIEMEIQTIKNESQIGKDSDWQAVIEEWRQFTDIYWNKKPNFDNVPDRVEYYTSYCNMYISFCDRVLAFEDLPDEVRTEWTNMKASMQRDLENNNADLKNYYDEDIKNSFSPEAFEDVYAEMQANIPDSASTIEEKELALEYIDRMLACEDIPNAGYWQNKKDIIEMEFLYINNLDVEPNKEKTEEVMEEFTNFINRYADSVDNTMTMEEKFDNRQMYYSTYKSFIYRLMHCADVTDTQKIEYSQMEFTANEEMTKIKNEYQQYLDEK